MKLQMQTSLGIADAKRLKIAEAREFDILDADDDTAEELLKRRWAIPFVAPAADIKAAASAPAKPGNGKPANA